MQREEERRIAWHQTTVSWGQLLVAALGLIVTVLGAVFIDRNAIEKRVTVLEREQDHIIERDRALAADVTATRSEIIARLDSIQKQMNEVIVAVARHESASARVLEEHKK